MRDNLILDVNTVIRIVNTCEKQIDGRWIPARPLGFWSWRYRLKATWLVFTGKADALIWPGGQ